MTQFTNVIKIINDFKDGTSMEAGVELHQQFERLANSDNDYDYIKEVIKQDDDVAERHFEQDTEEFEECREVQDAMITFFH